MPLTRTFGAVAVISAVLLAACDSIAGPSGRAPVAPAPTRLARPNLSPGPPPFAPPGAPLRSVTWSGRDETAQVRGSCPIGYAVLGADLPLPRPEFRCVYDSYSTDPVVARIGVAYPFSLGSLHCGVSAQQFDHALFVRDPPIVPPDIAAPTLTGFGTMTLTDAYHARYLDRSGAVIPFVAVSSIRLPLCG